MAGTDIVTEVMEEIIRRADDRSTTMQELIAMRGDVTRIAYGMQPLSRYGKISLATDSRMNDAAIRAQVSISDAIKRHLKAAETTGAA